MRVHTAGEPDECVDRGEDEDDRECVLPIGDRSTENYESMKEKLAGEKIDGLLVQTAGFDDGNGVWRLVDVWETREQAARFTQRMMNGQPRRSPAPRHRDATARSRELLRAARLPEQLSATDPRGRPALPSWLGAGRRPPPSYVVMNGPDSELQVALITLRRFAEFQNLQGAFGRRAIIEQAKGILMAETESTQTRHSNSSKLTRGGRG